MSLHSIKVPDEVPSVPKNVWTVRVRHQREYYPQIHVGGLLDICLQGRQPDIDIRASGQGQGSSSHVRSEDKSYNCNRNLKQQPQQKTNWPHELGLAAELAGEGRFGSLCLGIGRDVC